MDMEYHEILAAKPKRAYRRNDDGMLEIATVYKHGDQYLDGDLRELVSAGIYERLSGWPDENAEVYRDGNDTEYYIPVINHVRPLDEIGDDGKTMLEKLFYGEE